MTRIGVLAILLASCTTGDAASVPLDPFHDPDDPDDDDPDDGRQPPDCPTVGDTSLVIPGCACDALEPIACYQGPLATLGVGSCRAGLAYCEDGVFGACDGQVVPWDEICDRIDNNCDGTVDEGVTSECGTCGRCPPPEPPLGAGDPPVVACDAAGGEVCELPRSVCADSDWIVYYTGGECVEDVCRFEKNFEFCWEGCWDGGCSPGFT